MAKRLGNDISIELLVKVARADNLATGKKHNRQPHEDWLLEQAEILNVQQQAEPPVLMGRHLLRAGLEPGPIFSDLLSRAYEIQIEEGIDDPNTLLQRVL